MMVFLVGHVAVFLIIFLASYRLAELAPGYGQFAYYIFSVIPRKIPLFGPIYNRLTGTILNITFLFKFVSFLIGSSGILLIPICFQYIYPAFLIRIDFLYGLFAAALFTTLRIMEKVHLMEAPDVQSQFRTVMRDLNMDAASLDERLVARILRAQYADVVGVDFLIIVVCYGVTAFCGEKLGLFSFGTKPIDSPVEGVLEALTFLRFVTSSSPGLVGGWAIALNIFYGTCLFICLVFFVSLSSKLIDIKIPELPPDPYKELKDKILNKVK